MVLREIGESASIERETADAILLQPMARHFHRRMRHAVISQFLQRLVHRDRIGRGVAKIDRPAWPYRAQRAEARRALAVLAHMEGDHMDVASLAKLARVARLKPALTQLTRWHLVQQPLRDRYTLHAVVRHAVARRTRPAPDRVFEHYVTLLEQHPERLELEQSHLFAAMEHAYRKSDMYALLRVNALAERLERAQG